MAYQKVQAPSGGKITIHNGEIQCPDNPVIPFIRGDGTGPDIWAASERVFDAAVEKAYKGSRKIAWFEVFAGETAKNRFDDWLPEDTVNAFREYLVGIKGPAHHARWRRDSLAERGATPTPGFVRLPATRSVL